MAFLRCDECGASTSHQGSWDTPIRILCERCSKKNNEKHVVNAQRESNNVKNNSYGIGHLPI